MSHTPGPWTVETHRDVRWVVAVDKRICEFAYINAHEEANARLIAAAPDLLAALQRAIPEIAVVGMPELLEQARDAIKKARGA